MKIRCDRRICLFLVAFLAGCGGSSPTSPSQAAPPASVTGPRILLAGQSGAYFLLPYLPEAIDFTNIEGSVNFWLSNRDFAERARTANLLAFVWWQGAADVAMSTTEYSEKLRALIQIARSGNSGLPVRIVEIQDFPIRASVREAQRQVATDPGVQMIPTADLEVDTTNHFTPGANQTVRDRIYRSLGR